MEIINKKLEELDKDEINKIISILKQEKVIVIKTDTIYGFSCLASSQKAIEKIKKIKKRQTEKSFIILVSSLSMAAKYGDINSLQKNYLKDLIKRDEPISFVVKSKENCHTIAMRLPKSDFFIKIIKRLGEALISSSFNFSGQKLLDINNSQLIFKNKKYRPDLIINSGASKKTKASKLIDITGKKIKILRK